MKQKVLQGIGFVEGESFSLLLLIMSNLVDESKSHVIIPLLGLLLLLFLLGGSSGSSHSGRSSGFCSRGSAHSRAHIGDEILQAGRLQGLGEESGTAH